MARFSVVGLAILLAVSITTAQSGAQQQWEAFLARPVVASYEPLSATIRACVASKCTDSEVAGRNDDFANFYRLLKLVDRGDHFAMELTFQIRPLYENAAHPREEIAKSFGVSATAEPTFFLDLIRKYNIPAGIFEEFVVQTSWESVDRLAVKRNEWRSRIQALSRVSDPSSLRVRDQAISFIQAELDKYSTLPNDALGQ